MKSPEGKFQKTSTGAVRMQPKSDELKFVTKNDGYVHIHPSSVNYQVGMVGYTYIYIWQVLPGAAQSLRVSQTFYHSLSPAAPLTWGWLNKHEQTRNWTIWGKTISILRKFWVPKKCSNLLSDVKWSLCSGDLRSQGVTASLNVCPKGE